MSSRSRLVLAVSFAVVGFLLVTATSSASRARRAEEPRRAQLITLIENRRAQLGDLDKAVRALRSDVSSAERDAVRLRRLDQEQGRRNASLAAQAGTTGLRGDGLVVRLSDSDRTPTSAEDAGAYRIHDRDLQLVVNALLAAGAEAVAINDSRLVATTPIRSAGDTIVVNFRPLSPPYVVEAIGARASDFQASEIAQRFRRWSRLFGLGFSVRTQAVTVPPYTGRVTIATARPA